MTEPIYKHKLFLSHRVVHHLLKYSTISYRGIKGAKSTSTAVETSMYIVGNDFKQMEIYNKQLPRQLVQSRYFLFDVVVTLNIACKINQDWKIN